MIKHDDIKAKMFIKVFYVFYVYYNFIVLYIPKKLKFIIISTFFFVTSVL